MSATAVASPGSLHHHHHSFDIDSGPRHSSTHMASESPSTQRKARAPRQRQPPNSNNNNNNQHTAEVQSDSNLVSAQTPKAKKNRQRQGDNRGAASGNEAPCPRTTGKQPPRSRQTNGSRDSSAQLATPAKSLAYASAAFHQSPAASSLPMPKFLSKSVPAPPADASLQSRLDHETGKTSASPSPPTSATPEPLSSLKSPLDMFFNADRQEKAKKQSITSLNDIHNSPSLPHRTPTGGNKDMFMLELDQNESPTALASARPTLAPSMSSAPAPVPAGQNDAAAAAATQSLKDFLKLPSQRSAPSPQPQQPVQQPALPTESPSQPYLASPFVNSTPQQHNNASGFESPFHYGNRNLSPLFQAARSPDSGPAPANSDSPLQNRNASNQPQPFDPRAYLDQHVRSSSLANNSSFSPVQSQHGPNPFHQDSRTYPQQSNPIYASPSSRMPPSYAPVPQTGASQRQANNKPVGEADVKDMEAKLRNILKLG